MHSYPAHAQPQPSSPSSVTYLALPLTRHRWLFRVYVDGQEITDSRRHNGLLQLYPHQGTAELCRWAGLPLVRDVMLHHVCQSGYATAR